MVQFRRQLEPELSPPVTLRQLVKQTELRAGAGRRPRCRRAVMTRWVSSPFAACRPEQTVRRSSYLDLSTPWCQMVLTPPRTSRGPAVRVVRYAPGGRPPPRSATRSTDATGTSGRYKGTSTDSGTAVAAT